MKRLFTMVIGAVVVAAIAGACAVMKKNDCKTKELHEKLSETADKLENAATKE